MVESGISFLTQEKSFLLAFLSVCPNHQAPHTYLASYVARSTTSIFILHNGCVELDDALHFAPTNGTATATSVAKLGLPLS